MYLLWNSSPCPTPNRVPPTPSISADCHSVGTQTVESSLVPCDACASVQASLRESGAALVNLCETLGLPCSLQRLLVVAEDSAMAGRLSACDVAQWASEQKRDMGRLGKHHQEVSATLDALREQLKTAEEERGELKTRMEGEREERRRVEEVRKREEEEQERRQREERRKGEEEVKGLQEELEELRRGEGKNILDILSCPQEPPRDRRRIGFKDTYYKVMTGFSGYESCYNYLL